MNNHENSIFEWEIYIFSKACAEEFSPFSFRSSNTDTSCIAHVRWNSWIAEYVSGMHRFNKFNVFFIFSHNIDFRLITSMLHSSWRRWMANMLQHGSFKCKFRLNPVGCLSNTRYTSSFFSCSISLRDSLILFNRYFVSKHFANVIHTKLHFSSLVSILTHPQLHPSYLYSNWY